MGNIDADELIKDRLLNKFGNTSSNMTNGWRSILDDIVISAKASGKKTAFTQLNVMMEEHIAEIKQLVQAHRFEDAEKLTTEMLQYIQKGGE